MADGEYILAEETPRTPVIREIPPEPSNLKRNITIAIWGIILVVLALFIGQNWRDVPLTFLFWDFTVKLSFALLAAALIGIVLGFSISIYLRRRKKE